ncbi:Glycerol-3-phosphate dehydrogenase [NAD(+)] [Folsomia candida]|uniref:Glycerol-3-phosphate dehydrogenase [NAD(+)] n=1 Tax=Folsomia candida TaxID=158441 RepID=A0A226EDN4_FOLCA|nr:Glycerol-3-phosphate dehydrogenase [NAD(+)] [Folsomia candida]
MVTDRTACPGQQKLKKIISPSDVDEWTKLCRKVLDLSPNLEELCLEVPVLATFSWFPVEERLTGLKILRLDILPATSEWGNDAMAKIIMQETPNLVTFTSSYFGTGLHTSILKLLTGSDEFWPKLTNIGCPRKGRREGMSTNQLEQVQAVLDKHCETVELIELNPVLSLRLVPMDLPRIPSLKKLAIWEYDVSEYELYSLFSQIYKMPRGVVKQNVAPCNDWSREKLDFFNLFDLFGDIEKFKDRFPSLHAVIFTVPSGRYESYVYNAIFPKKKIASSQQSMS